MTVSIMGQKAQVYARKKGWKVFPLREREKMPATANGFKDATSDLEEIARLWGEREYNVGLATGEGSGVWVFDVDGDAPKGGGLTGPEALALLEERHGALPPTLMVKTGNGAHYYYRMPVGRDLRNRARITIDGQRTGLDVRADGGYVVLPPSVHPNGQAYAFVKGCNEVSDAPDWLLDALYPRKTEPAPKPNTTPSATDEDIATGAEVLQIAAQRILTCTGSRHDAIYRESAVIGELVAGGCIDRGAATAALVAAGIEAGKPEVEVRRTVRDGLDRGAQHPRRFSDAPSAIPATLYRPSDVGNAARLVDRFGGDVRWCDTAQGEGWLVWDGKRWSPDSMRRVDAMSREVAVDVVTYAAELQERARAASAAAGQTTTPAQQRALAQLRSEAKSWMLWARQSEMVSHLSAVAKVARTDVAIAHEALDADPWLLNTQNGIVDLRSDAQRPHEREARMTKIAGTEMGNRYGCPTWVAFLTRIMGGDTEMVSFIQRVVGYCLTGSTREQCLFILYGNGSNGKSTFLDTLRAVMGDYAMHARAETFVRDSRGGIPNDIAALRGARLVTASEPEQGEQLDEGLVKEMTGDAAMTARFMRSEFFTFTPTFKVLLATNHRPIIRGTDHGIWRRIRLVPFTETIAEHEKDRDLGAKLAAESPGILAWAVQGCVEWQRIGLASPAVVTDATQDYRADMDILSEFIEEKCMLYATVGNTALYQAFSAWSAANGERPRSHRWLTRALTDRGYKQDPNRSAGRRWLGLSLREQPSPGASRADRSTFY
jgi:putative DNA primase/helicase